MNTTLKKTRGNAYWWWVEIHHAQSWFVFSWRENQTYWWLFHCHLPQQNIYHVHESISSMILSVWWCIRSRYVVLCYYIFTSPGKLSAFNLIGENLELIYDFIYLCIKLYTKIYIISHHHPIPPKYPSFNKFKPKYCKLSNDLNHHFLNIKYFHKLIHKPNPNPNHSLSLK